jgi:pyruvate formate lyase activating enzyme
MIDAPFFKNGRGGVTLSGGECLSQGEFATEVARLLRENGISVYIDTCGYVKREILDSIIPYADKFLYDIKAMSPQVHKEATGRDNGIILDNLVYLCRCGCKIEVRIPFVPQINGNEMEAIGGFLSELPIEGVKLLPYHRYAESRYESLGMENRMPEIIPTENELSNAATVLERFGLNVINV